MAALQISPALPNKSLQMLPGPPSARLYASLLPSLMICLAATAEERWMGSMKMLSVSASETTEYLRKGEWAQYHVPEGIPTVETWSDFTYMW